MHDAVLAHKLGTIDAASPGRALWLCYLEGGEVVLVTDQNPFSISIASQTTQGVRRAR